MPECQRCGIPTPDDPRASKYGGMNLARDGESDICIACYDYLHEQAERAQHRLDDPEWDPEQAALTDYK